MLVICRGYEILTVGIKRMAAISHSFLCVKLLSSKVLLETDLLSEQNWCELVISWLLQFFC